FFAREAQRFGVPLERPFRIELAAPRSLDVPVLSSSPSLPEAVIFGLKLRWLALRLGWSDALPPGDITVLAVFHDGEVTSTLDRSTGLQKGMVAVANLSAARAAAGSNHVVLAHELLHTLGATDKYDLATNR